jgi:hypothetical protein
MVETGVAGNPDEAIALGNILVQHKMLRHVVDEHAFENKYLFYSFDDSKLARQDLATLDINDTENDPSSPRLTEPTAADYDGKWLSNCKPADWSDPMAIEKYNLVVIGGGVAGMNVAKVAS